MPRGNCAVLLRFTAARKIFLLAMLFPGEIRNVNAVRLRISLQLYFAEMESMTVTIVIVMMTDDLLNIYIFVDFFQMYIKIHIQKDRGRKILILHIYFGLVF